MSQVHEIQCELCRARAEVLVDFESGTGNVTIRKGLAWYVKVTTVAHDRAEDYPFSGLAVEFYCPAHDRERQLALEQAGRHVERREP
jgi:hypothetical protein